VLFIKCLSHISILSKNIKNIFGSLNETDFTFSLLYSCVERLGISRILMAHRKLAESAMQQLKVFFPEMKGSWTATEALPGGENMESVEQLMREIRAQVTDASEDLVKRWASAYGSRIWNILGEKSSVEQLGQHFGQGLYAREVDYLCTAEWVTTSQDVLWRRSKLGLSFTQKETETLDAYLIVKTHSNEAA
jgi:glycerol-3-phosphate dehydrogenase